MRPVTLVGSRQNAHLHLLSRSVSKAHALLLNSDGGLYIRDLSSRTHIYVNGQEVREANLADGDIVKVGSFTFKYQAAAGMKQRPRMDELPAAALEVTGAEFPLSVEGRVMLIGRRASCDVSLIEESVSTCHAVLFSMNGKRYVRDLGSRTGTFVNNKQEKQVELRFGDTIKIGDTVLGYSPVAGPAGSGVDEMDEFEDLIGTAPLVPSDLVPESVVGVAVTPPRSDAAASRGKAAAPAPKADVSVRKANLGRIDLDADPDVSGLAPPLSPHETARIPLDVEEPARKSTAAPPGRRSPSPVARPSAPIPLAPEPVEEPSLGHVDAEHEEAGQQFLVGPNLLNEKLSSSGSGQSLQQAAREARELAKKSPEPPVPVAEVARRGAPPAMPTPVVEAPRREPAPPVPAAAVAEAAKAAPPPPILVIAPEPEPELVAEAPPPVVEPAMPVHVEPELVTLEPQPEPAWGDAAPMDEVPLWEAPLEPMEAEEFPALESTVEEIPLDPGPESHATEIASAPVDAIESEPEAHEPSGAAEAPAIDELEALPEMAPVSETPWEVAAHAEPADAEPADAEPAEAVEASAAGPEAEVLAEEIAQPAPMAPAPAPQAEPAQKKSRWGWLGFGRRREEEKKPAGAPPMSAPAARTPSHGPEVPAFAASAAAEADLELGDFPTQIEPLDLDQLAPAAAMELPGAEISPQTLSAHDEMALDEWEVTGAFAASLPRAVVVSEAPAPQAGASSSEAPAAEERPEVVDLDFGDDLPDVVADVPAPREENDPVQNLFYDEPALAEPAAVHEAPAAIAPPIEPTFEEASIEPAVEEASIEEALHIDAPAEAVAVAEISVPEPIAPESVEPVAETPALEGAIAESSLPEAAPLVDVAPEPMSSAGPVEVEPLGAALPATESSAGEESNAAAEAMDFAGLAASVQPLNLLAPEQTALPAEQFPVDLELWTPEPFDASLPRSLDLNSPEPEAAFAVSETPSIAEQSIEPAPEIAEAPAAEAVAAEAAVAEPVVAETVTAETTEAQVPEGVAVEAVVAEPGVAETEAAEAQAPEAVAVEAVTAEPLAAEIAPIEPHAEAAEIPDVAPSDAAILDTVPAEATSAEPVVAETSPVETSAVPPEAVESVPALEAAAEGTAISETPALELQESLPAELVFDAPPAVAFEPVAAPVEPEPEAAPVVAPAELKLDVTPAPEIHLEAAAEFDSAKGQADDLIFSGEGTGESDAARAVDDSFSGELAGLIFDDPEAPVAAGTPAPPISAEVAAPEPAAVAREPIALPEAAAVAEPLTTDHAAPAAEQSPAAEPAVQEFVPTAVEAVPSDAAPAEAMPADAAGEPATTATWAEPIDLDAVEPMHELEAVAPAAEEETGVEIVFAPPAEESAEWEPAAEPIAPEAAAPELSEEQPVDEVSAPAHDDAVASPAEADAPMVAAEDYGVELLVAGEAVELPAYDAPHATEPESAHDAGVDELDLHDEALAVAHEGSATEESAVASPEGTDDDVVPLEIDTEAGGIEWVTQETTPAEATAVSEPSFEDYLSAEEPAGTDGAIPGDPALMSELVPAPTVDSADQEELVLELDPDAAEEIPAIESDADGEVVAEHQTDTPDETAQEATVHDELALAEDVGFAPDSEHIEGDASEITTEVTAAPVAEVPPEAATLSEPSSPEAVAPEPQGYTSTAGFFGSDQGSFLGGMPLQLTELPPPPRFGQVPVSFNDQADKLRSAARKNQQGKPGDPEAMKLAPGDATDEAGVGDEQGETLVQRSKLFIPRQVTPPPRRPRMDERSPEAEKSGASASDSTKPFGQVATPGEPTSAGFGQQARPFGTLSGPVREVDVFGGGLSHDLSKDPFFGNAVKEAPVRPARKGAKGLKTEAAKAASRSQTGAAGVKLAGQPGAMPPLATGENEVVALAETLADELNAASMPSGDIAVDPGRGQALPKDRSVKPNGKRRPAAQPAVSDFAGPRVGAKGAYERNAPPVQTADQGRNLMVPSPAPRRRMSVGILLLIMFLLMVGSAAAIYAVLKVKTSVEATLKYEIGSKVTDGEWRVIEREQSDLLAKERVREVALSNFKSKGSGYDPGFLADRPEFYRNMSRVHWDGDPPGTQRGMLLFRYDGSDAQADRLRVESLMAAFRSENSDGTQAHTEQANLDIQQRDLDAKLRSLEEVKQLRAEKRKIVDFIHGPELITSLKADSEKARKASFAATDALDNLDREIARIEQGLPQGAVPATGPGAGPGAPQSPVDGTSGSVAVTDPQLQQMQKEMGVLQARLNAARAEEAQNASEAHKSVDAAMNDFQQALQKGQEFKDASGLSAYIKAAQALQETTAKFTGELLDAQQKRNAELVDLKKSLDEQMEARRKDLLAKDPELKRLQDDLKMREHGFRAALDTGMVKEANDIRREMDQASARIEDRKRQIGQDMMLAGLALKLQEQIERMQKDLDVNRLRSDQMLAESQKRFADAAPSVEKLPAEQKAFVAELSAKMKSMNDARAQYTQTMQARDAAASGQAAKETEQQAKALGGKIDDRLRELSAANAQQMGAQEAKQRLALLAKKKAEREVAAKTLEDARSVQISAQDTLDQARSNEARVRQAGEELQTLNNKQTELEAAIRIAEQTRDQTQDMVGKAIYLRPGDADIRVTEGKDVRPMYVAGSWAMIFILFSGLLLRAGSHSHPPMAVAATSMEHDESAEDESSTPGGPEYPEASNGSPDDAADDEAPLDEHSVVA